LSFALWLRKTSNLKLLSSEVSVGMTLFWLLRQASCTARRAKPSAENAVVASVRRDSTVAADGRRRALFPSWNSLLETAEKISPPPSVGGYGGAASSLPGSGVGEEGMLKWMISTRSAWKSKKRALRWSPCAGFGSSPPGFTVHALLTSAK
jgi:hypothetical protein